MLLCDDTGCTRTCNGWDLIVVPKKSGSIACAANKTEAPATARRPLGKGLQIQRDHANTVCCFDKDAARSVLGVHADMEYGQCTRGLWRVSLPCSSCGVALMDPWFGTLLCFRARK